MDSRPTYPDIYRNIFYLNQVPPSLTTASKESSLQFVSPEEEMDIDEVARIFTPRRGEERHLPMAPPTFVSISAPDLSLRDSTCLPPPSPTARSVELPEFHLFGYVPTERSAFSPATPDPSLHYKEDIERMIEERRLGERRSADAICQQQPRKSSIAKPTYRIFPIMFYYHIEPTHYEDPAEELAVRRSVFDAFEWALDGQIAAAATLGAAAREMSFPDFTWRSHTEDGVFDLRSPPSKRLQRGDVLHCYGGMRGYWRLGGPVKRYRTREDPNDPEETNWVQVMCQNDRDHQEAWLKIPACFFYPSPPFDRLRRFVRRSLHNLRTIFKKGEDETMNISRESTELEYATVKF
ncbi:hypothetical protein C8R45DRAFT_1100688 [Mycena sanguinolenta]|nr:hypothetical protein C8R45DRAFT_1100688 [Mycena sanguinolenta]